ncbi:MAG: putative Ig domain-containing protein [Bacteroidota bacterium]
MLLKNSILLSIFTFSTVSVLISGQSDIIRLDKGWKFTPGDSLVYANPGFDDSRWVPIRVDTIWEIQGYPNLDGYAWYRIKFYLPSSLKNNAYIKDGLRIFLGKINNFDQSFLNGKIFGVNAKVVPEDTPIDSSYTKADVGLWNTERPYILAADDARILWDKDNVIAVRVFDAGGQGGIWNGNPNIRMVNFTDYLSFDNSFRPFEFSDGSTSKTFTMKNTSSNHDIRGKLSIIAVNKLTNEEAARYQNDNELKPQVSKEITFSMKGQDQASIVTYIFTFSDVQDTMTFREETPYVLTPKPGEAPKIHGANVYGERVNKPFRYTIAATGKRPMTFESKDLPEGLMLNQMTGIITGRVKDKGKFNIQLTAKNSDGEDHTNVRFIIGDQVALTPPMGWNSWNAWGLSVDQEKVIASARVFKEKGLMNHGWTYINIDDGWEIVGNSPHPQRDSLGNIITNEKFPDMKALGDSIHSLGLKFGIYSSPGPLTCGGYTASYQHELNDATSYASWGIDYLKYDWCSYDKIAKDTTLPEYKAPYIVMRNALDKVDRDIVFSLCQYGMGKVWEWGADVGGNLWRTTGDITDTWESMSDIGFNQIENAKYAQPGHWNDPDMLVVGWVGWGPSLHPTQLTPDEQYTHISLWCMLSAPLLIGCDLTRLDDFTLNLLTNDEILAIDQDPLGKQATPALNDGYIQVWVKELADGSKAFGVFNTGTKSEQYSIDFSKIGIHENTHLRDLWRQKEIPVNGNTVDLHLPSHGVVMIKTMK